MQQWLADLQREWGPRNEDREEPNRPESDHALVKLINRIIIQAQALGASDIHIETPAGQDPVSVRVRRDGRLELLLELPASLRRALVARVKVMAGLDVSERRRPQDGRINFAHHAPGHQLELRAVTVPTQQGLEDVVLRLLSTAEPLPLDRLGLHAQTLKHLRQVIERPHGLILCAGPTGSGKTTTLHAVLGYLNTPARKIWTAEDPIEITQAGLRQVQVQPRLDWTFDKALRAFLRADPDIIMVGEVRDRETAHTAVEAALTGHLVLSTIHTNGAAETITRLLEMGIDPFHFGDSLLAVIGQRLVRRWCPACVERPPTDEAELQAWLRHAQSPEEGHGREEADLLADWLQRFGRDGRLWGARARGCSACHGTGWQGRIGVYELLVITPEIRRLIHRREPAAAIHACALQQGLRSLHQDGLDKVLQGWTSLPEVLTTVQT